MLIPSRADRQTVILVIDRLPADEHVPRKLPEDKYTHTSEEWLSM